MGEREELIDILRSQAELLRTSNLPSFAITMEEAATALESAAVESALEEFRETAAKVAWAMSKNGATHEEIATAVRAISLPPAPGGE